MRNRGNVGYWLLNAGIPLWQREKSVTKAGYSWLPVVTWKLQTDTHSSGKIAKIPYEQEGVSTMEC